MELVTELSRWLPIRSINILSLQDRFDTREQQTREQPLAETRILSPEQAPILAQALMDVAKKIQEKHG